jgi:hypothetical protein
MLLFALALGFANPVDRIATEGSPADFAILNEVLKPSPSPQADVPVTESPLYAETYS